MADVFISYSRLDKEFVGLLRELLIAKGQEVWIDWESIPPSQAWWNEIQKGIAKANNFVLVMSPNSMASPICQMEIEYARHLKKRIIPVLHLDFEREECLVSITKRLAKKEETTTREIWDTRQPHDLFDSNDAELKHINYFMFKADADFQTRFHELFEVISTDYQHKEHHTTLQLRAEEWERRNRDSGFLLNGNELDSSEQWLLNYDVDAKHRRLKSESTKLPEPTEIQRTYITFSRQEENARTNRLAELETSRLKSEGAAQTARRVLIGVAILGALIVMGVLIITRTQVNDANIWVIKANAQVETATYEQGQAQQTVENVAARLTPIGATLTAIHNDISTSQAVGTQVALDVMKNHALFMANLSEQQLKNNYPQEASLLALESLGNFGTLIPYPNESLLALQDALNNPVREATYMRHDNYVNGAVWSHDESHILTWSEDDTAQVWDASDGTTLLTLRHAASVAGAVWNRDESRIMTWSLDGTARIWDAKSGAELLMLRHDNDVFGALWSQDESRILTWSLDGTARVWNAKSGAELLTLPHDSYSSVAGPLWSQDESRILTWLFDGTVRVWDAKSGAELLTLHHDNDVVGAVWNRDESRILTWSTDGTARIWDTSSGTGFVTLRHDSYVLGAVWNQDESRILAWSEDGTARVYDTSDGTTLQTLHLSDPVGGAIWNRDESRILTWSFDSFVRVWSDASGIPMIVMLYHDSYVFGAAWNQDGSRILTWSEDGTARVWDANSGTLLLTLRHDSAVSGAAWNQDESRILTWSKDGTVRVWDANSGTLLLTLRHDSVVFGAAWNQDGSRILTWSEDGTARVWDANSGTLLLTLRHDSYVLGAVWNQDESRILTWSEDGTARVWDANSGTLLLTLRHDSAVFGAAWNRDESRILTWSKDGTARVWSADIPELIAFAQSRKTRDLSNEQREQFFLPTLPPTPTFSNLVITPVPTLTSLPERATITSLPTLTPSLTPTVSSTPSLLPTSA